MRHCGGFNGGGRVHRGSLRLKEADDIRSPTEKKGKVWTHRVGGEDTREVNLQHEKELKKGRPEQGREKW